MFAKIKKYIDELDRDRRNMMPTKFEKRLYELGFIKTEPYIWTLQYIYHDMINGYGDPITEDRLFSMTPKDLYNFYIDQAIKILEANKL